MAMRVIVGVIALVAILQVQALPLATGDGLLLVPAVEEAMLDSGIWIVQLGNKTYAFDVTPRTTPLFFASQDGVNWTEEFPHYKEYEIQSQDSPGAGIVTVSSDWITANINVDNTTWIIDLPQNGSLLHPVSSWEEPTATGIGILVTTRDRDVKIQLDSYVVGRVSSATSFIASSFSHADTIYEREFSMSFTSPTIYRCLSMQCDDAVGLGNYTDSLKTLIKDFTKEQGDMHAAGLSSGDFEFAVGVIGRTDPDRFGLGTAPGRYSMSTVADITDRYGTYNGQTSTYEQGLNIAHEMGHGLTGTHAQGTTNYYQRYAGYHCEPALLDLPVIGCLEPFRVNDYYQEVQYSLMKGGYVHDPPTHVNYGYVSSANYNDMRDCWRDDFDTMSYDYDDYTDTLGLNWRATDGCA